MTWRLTDAANNREIARGGLEECARALLADESAILCADDVGDAIRIYAVIERPGDGFRNSTVEVIKGGGQFRVKTETAKGDESRLPLVVQQITAVLKLAGGHAMGDRQPDLFDL
jgi:hypothetical protein